MNRTVQISAVLVGFAGVVFLIENIFMIGQQGATIVFLPIVVLLLDFLAVYLIINGNKTLRTGVLMIVGIGLLVDVVVVLAGVPAWVRALTALLALVQIAALVLLNTKPARAHFNTAET